MSGFIAESWEMQRSLSRAQTTPILGPLLVSPVKALVSTVQLVAGIAGAILFGAIFALTFNEKVGSLAGKSLMHAGMGALCLVYSIINILSLGIAGHNLESLQNRASSYPFIQLYA